MLNMHTTLCLDTKQNDVQFMDEAFYCLTVVMY